MSPLRQRMIAAMTVRGMSLRTIECYTESIARLSRHYGGHNPARLSPEQIEAYLLYLVQERKLSYSSVNHAASACRFLFETVLGRLTELGHLHAVMACGMLVQQQGQQWHTPVRQPDYLFPTRALSKLWRGKFMAELRQGISQASAWPMSANQRQALWKKDWVVYAKTPLGGAAQVLAYLSRYTHRTAIGNERTLGMPGDEVVISARAQGKAGEQGTRRRIRMKAQDFIARFLQHILPRGLKRIRHYGLLANPSGQRLAQAKAALHMPAGGRAAQEAAQDFMARVSKFNITQCPACAHGRLIVVQTLPSPKRLPDPLGQARAVRPAANSRGPPESAARRA